MDEALKADIEGILSNHPVVLFMKGSRSFPQCGFSATVVNILREAGVREIKDVNILQRSDLREGLKEYASWPTFPQLYVKGQLVGGCDIVKEMFASGELYDVLGVPRPVVAVPTLTVTDAAKQAIQNAAEGESGALRVEISPSFEYGLSIDEPRDGDLRAEVNGLTVLFDRQSAQRANGMRIDFEGSGGGGFKIENPNEPPRVRPISVQELKQRLEQGPLELFDVRTEQERAIAKLEAATHYDEAAQGRLAKLDKSTPLYFMCHHGGRSQQAAEHYLRQGFTEVYNVAGGIDEWALEIDPGLKRY